MKKNLLVVNLVSLLLMIFLGGCGSVDEVSDAAEVYDNAGNNDTFGVNAHVR